MFPFQIKCSREVNWCLTPLSNNISVISLQSIFIYGGRWRTQRKHDSKSLTTFSLHVVCSIHPLNKYESWTKKSLWWWDICFVGVSWKVTMFQICWLQSYLPHTIVFNEEYNLDLTVNMCDCCLPSNKKYFSYIMARTSYIW